MGNLTRHISPAFNWFMQRITAIILAIGLLIHFYVLHFAIDRPVTFEKVQERLLTPAWVLFDIILLFAVVYHALYGLFNVINDYNPGEIFRKTLGWIFFIIGIILVVYGIMALLPFTRTGGMS